MKTINIPKKVVYSFLIGIPFSIVLLFATHIFSDWEVLYNEVQRQNNYLKLGEYKDDVGSAYFNCVFGKEHYLDATTKDLKDIEADFSSYKVLGALKWTFTEHLLTILLLSIGFTPIIYFFKSYKFKVT